MVSGASVSTVLVEPIISGMVSRPPGPVQIVPKGQQPPLSQYWVGAQPPGPPLQQVHVSEMQWPRPPHCFSVDGQGAGTSWLLTVWTASKIRMNWNIVDLHLCDQEWAGIKIAKRVNEKHESKPERTSVLQCK